MHRGPTRRLNRGLIRNRRPMSTWRLMKILGLFMALILGNSSGDGGDGDDDSNSGDDDAGDSGGDGDDGSGDDGSDGKPLTQKQVDALVQKRVRQATRKARQDVLADLGVDSADDAKATIEAARKKADAEKGDLERAQTEAAEAKKAADAAEARAARAELTTSLQEALTTAVDGDGNLRPVRPDRLSIALRLALDEAESADEDAIADAVESVMEQSPEWFGASASDDDDADDGNGTGPNPRPRKRSNRDRVKPDNRKDRVAERVKRHQERGRNSPAAGLVPE